MRPVLGIAVEQARLSAVALVHGRAVWAAETAYSTTADLEAALAHLAADRPPGVRRARVALAGRVAQVKVVEKLPPLGPRELAAHVALEPKRYFLANGHALATDAIPLEGARGNGRHPALLVAAPEPTLAAVAAGLAAAGLTLETMAPAAAGDVSALSDAPRALETLGERGDLFLVAYVAAATRNPPVALWPSALRREKDRATSRAMRRWLLLGAAMWLLAGAAYLASLAQQRAQAEAELSTDRARLDQVLALRRDLDASSDALGFLARARASRPRQAALLASVTAALPDSAFLALLRVDADGRGTLAGYAPRAAEVVAALERAGVVRGTRLEGPLGREVAGGREWDRFTIEFQLRLARRTP